MWFPPFNIRWWQFFISQITTAAQQPWYIKKGEINPHNLMVSTSARIFVCCLLRFWYSLHTVTCGSNNELQDSCLDNHYSQIILPYTSCCHKILFVREKQSQMKCNCSCLIIETWEERRSSFLCVLVWMRDWNCVYGFNGNKSLCDTELFLCIWCCLLACLLTMTIRAFSSVKRRWQFIDSICEEFNILRWNFELFFIKSLLEFFF